MKKIITSCWLWLMIIAVNISVLTLMLLNKFGYFPSLLKNELFWGSLSSGATFIGVIVAVFTYIHSEKVRKKQATYDAYNKFKNDFFDTENEIISMDLQRVLKLKIISDKYNSKKECRDWNIIKKYLAHVERIATCVNCNIFDAKTIYNMGGPFMIEMYSDLEKIIEYKRKKDNNDGVYEEFENMVVLLKRIKKNVK